jgi:hypothetical protein
MTSLHTSQCHDIKRWSHPFREEGSDGIEKAVGSRKPDMEEKIRGTAKVISK